MWSARFLSHMNHVSVSPTDGNGPTQGQRKTLTRVGIEPTTFGLDLRRCTDWATRSDGSRPWELKMLKSRQWTCTSTRKGYVLYKRWPCSLYKRWPLAVFNSHPGQSFSLSLGGPISISRANAHMVIIIIITKIYRAPKTINTLRRYLQQLECIVIICKII